MVANKKTHFSHLLKKIWQWGALACLINMMHYGVAMGQCIQPPTVLRVSNTAPFGTVEIKRTSTTNSSVYKTEFNVNTAPCTTSKDIHIQFGKPTSLTLTISNNILTVSYSPLLGGTNCSGFSSTVEFLLVNCKNAIGGIVKPSINQLRSGLTSKVAGDLRIWRFSPPRSLWLSLLRAFVVGRERGAGHACQEESSWRHGASSRSGTPLLRRRSSRATEDMA